MVCPNISLNTNPDAANVREQYPAIQRSGVLGFRHEGIALLSCHRFEPWALFPPIWVNVALLS